MESKMGKINEAIGKMVITATTIGGLAAGGHMIISDVKENIHVSYGKSRQMQQERQYAEATQREEAGDTANYDSESRSTLDDLIGGFR